MWPVPFWSNEKNQHAEKMPKKKKLTYKSYKFHSKNNTSDPKIEPKSQPNHLTESTNLSQQLEGLGIIWPGSLGNTNWVGSKMHVKQEEVPFLCLIEDLDGKDPPPRLRGVG
jgi:hypothetical protein